MPKVGREYIPEYGKRNHLRFINDLIEIFTDSLIKLKANNSDRKQIYDNLASTKVKVDALTQYLDQLPKNTTNKDALKILMQIQNEIRDTRTRLNNIEHNWSAIATNLGLGIKTSEDIRTIVTESLESIYPSGELVDDIRNELTRLETLLNELETRQNHELDDD